jgi:hypothetical protein
MIYCDEWVLFSSYIELMGALLGPQASSPANLATKVL